MKKILLTVAIISSAFALNAQTFCTELFISEYVEGSSHSKALEIYNPTNAPVVLSNYRLIRYSNGSAVPVDSFDLTGTVAAHDVWVVTNGQATPDAQGAFCDSVLMGMADQLGPAPYVAGTAVMFMNGDDALGLARISPYAIIDIFGKIGEDPGNSWSDVFPYTDAQGAWWTRDHALQRKSTVTGGVTVNPTAFNVTLEYDSLPEDTWTNLGIHNCVCNNVGIADRNIGEKMSVYPNPSNGEFVINTTEKIAHIEVINALGQVVTVEEFTSSEQQTTKRVDLTSMPGGIYMVQVQLENGVVLTSKITKR
jgi:hypothetical protein